MAEHKRRSRIAKLGIFLVTSLVCFLIVEIALRLFFPVYQTSILEAYEYDEELGTRLKAGVHFYETTDFQDEMKTNKLGTTNFQENWDAYENLVVAVGDSYTQGTGLPMDLNFPAQLDHSLNRDDAGNFVPKLGVVNIGVPGYGGEQSFIALTRWWNAQAKKPKYILYMGCDNDYEDDVLFKSGYRHKHLVDGNPRWEPFVKPLQWITSDLQTAIRLKVTLGRFRRRAVGVQDGASANTVQGPSVAELQGPALDRLADFAAANGSNLIVSWSDQGRSYQFAKAWAAERNLGFADWEKNFEAVREIAPALPLNNFHSGGHHRGWVNRVIADAYYAEIRKISNR